MQMASSSILSLSVLLFLFSITSASTRKWSLPNGLNQNPIKLIEDAIVVSEDLLELNGMAVTTRVTSHAVVVGPWGGLGNSTWDDGTYTGIHKIILKFGDTIDSIQVTYRENCILIAGPRRGGSGGSKTATIELASDEYITGLSGNISSLEYTSTEAIRSLKFTTNKKTYGPYGVRYGEPFSLPIREGFIVGFIGRSSNVLNAIGIRLLP